MKKLILANGKDILFSNQKAYEKINTFFDNAVISQGIQENSYIVNHKEENLEDLNELDINKFKYYSSILMVKSMSSNEEFFFKKCIYLK